jgi:hypothetical protein
MPHLPLDVSRQPDDTACGPTCLEAVYRYYGRKSDLNRIIAEVPALDTGGTLAVHLGSHALRNGFQAVIYTCNLQVFDLTWFVPGVDLAAKLQAQIKAKRKHKLQEACRAYLQFLELGGRVCHEPFTAELLGRHLDRKVPVMAGLSATYLYGSCRELNDVDDDVAGEPVGHFVVVTGFDAGRGEVQVADPLHDNPGFRAATYAVKTDRLIAAVLLGIVSYDANLLVIETSSPWPIVDGESPGA